MHMFMNNNQIWANYDVTRHLSSCITLYHACIILEVFLVLLMANCQIEELKWEARRTDIKQNKKKKKKNRRRNKKKIEINNWSK